MKLSKDETEAKGEVRSVVASLFVFQDRQNLMIMDPRLQPSVFSFFLNHNNLLFHYFATSFHIPKINNNYFLLTKK